MFQYDRFAVRDHRPMSRRVPCTLSTRAQCTLCSKRLTHQAWVFSFLFFFLTVVRYHEVGGNALTVHMLSDPRASSVLVKGSANLFSFIQHRPGFSNPEHSKKKVWPLTSF